MQTTLGGARNKVLLKIATGKSTVQLVMDPKLSYEGLNSWGKGRSAMHIRVLETPM